MIIADTDVLIDTLKGKEPSASRVIEELVKGQLATTTITVFELLSGAKRPGQAEKIRQLLRPITIFPLDELASTAAAEMRRHLEKEGQKINVADYLIAGICSVRLAPLMTRNRKHFERIPDLVLCDL